MYMLYKTFNFISASVLISLTMNSCRATHKPQYRTELVVRQDVHQRVSINGTLRGLRQTQIQPGYPGYVGQLFVEVGQKVRQGQNLVSILQAINQPPSEVFPIRAPFAGTVTQVLKRTGEYVAPATVASMETAGGLLVLTDLSSIWIDAQVPELEITKVAIGLKANVRANALIGKSYEAIIRSISLSPRISTDRWDRGRVEYPLDLEVLNHDEDLRPGMTVMADIISASAEQALTLPHEFIHRDEGGYFVVDSLGEQHRVTVGLSDESVMEIKHGVTEGMKVRMVDYGGSRK